LEVDPFIEGGTYQVAVELTDPEMESGAANPVVLGELEVQAVDRVFVAPDVGVKADVKFGADLRLVGYNLDVRHDELQVTLHWQALHRVGGYYKFFVHLYDLESGKLVSQADVVPRNWTYPTNWWEAGEFVSDEVMLSLGGVTSGTYSLFVGVYEFEGARLPVSSGGDRYMLVDHMTLPLVP
jgi:hypothetical protein